MNTFLKKAALAAALATASLSAHAAEVDIAVWADVDPALSMMKADGSALDDSVKLTHDASSGLLLDWKERVRIHSNDTAKDITVRLGASPSLTPEVGSGGTPVPLAVSLNGEALSTTAKDFEASSIFDGALPGRSIPMDLIIGQGNDTAIDVAGRYEGIVTLVLLQKP
ncbi:CS1 type fimbrial major subunit [Stenotrophomonas cyclobalanopsidis]|uniref:CS1 type fimbrial major subunit n=1 Tax=Stenotrophomonas cyclobalanopsidis TaxID=2771362 RepID=UPI0028ACBB9D|nr:CS1 type fimbrial major subunit [Stenotrophomonas cyclobalanopsidis]